jgi:transposase
MALDLHVFPDPETITSLAHARQVIALQSALIKDFLARVEQLESQLAKNSRTSSKPPSSDGYQKPKPKSRRTKGQRPSGGQRGHQGMTLKQVAHPDDTEILPLRSCHRCGHSLAAQAVKDTECRQVFDVPPQRLHVKAYHAEIKACPGCGKTARAPFPAAVTQPVQYGQHIKAMVVYLSQYQLLPYRRLQELLHDLFNARLSQGTIHTMLSQCSYQLGVFEQAAKLRLMDSPVAHFDATGMRIDTALHWLHVASTEQLTYYHFDDKRGTRAMDAMNILPSFQGTAVHDHWQSYYRYDCQHALCNAHHLRELTHAHEQHGQQWAQRLITCLLDANAEVDAAIGRDRPILPTHRQAYYQRRYSRILRQGRDELPQLTPPQHKRRGRRKQHAAKNLHDRRVKHKYEVLAYVYDFSIPFDNNLAERDLRMGKVKQKISGCFRSPTEARSFARVRGYISTIKKNSLNVFDSLVLAVNGQPVMPNSI